MFVFKFKTTNMLDERKFRDLYDNLLESGLTIHDYCANLGINRSTFYYWQHKIKKQLPPKKGFIPLVYGKENQSRPLQVAATANDTARTFSTPGDSDKSISCEINYPNGICVKMNGLSNTEVLRSLLHLTQQQDV